MDKKAYIKPELRATKRIIRPSMICKSGEQESLKMLKRKKGNDGQQELVNPWNVD